MTRLLSEDRPLLGGGQVKLPQTQTVSDKKHIIENKKKTIAEMKDLLLLEINAAGYCDLYVKRIENTLNPQKFTNQTKENMNNILKSLAKSKRVSKRANRVAEIILDEQEGIECAKEAIAVFERAEQKSKVAFDRMRQTQELLKHTGRQNQGK